MTEEENLELRASLIEMQAKIAALETQLEHAQESAQALVIANNAFRSAMLARAFPASIDKIYLAKSRVTWATMPVEDLMQFYEVFSAHTQIFNDLIIQKKGRSAIADHLLAKAAADAAEVKAFKEKQDFKKPPKVASSNNSPELSEPDKNKKKALAGLMKALNLTEDAARAMLAGMEAKNG